MGLNLSYADAVLKEFYEGPIRDAIWQKVALLNWLEASGKPWDGRRVIIPVIASRGYAVGARTEEATLPLAKYQPTLNSYITATYQYGHIQLSGQVMAATKKNAFIDAVTLEINSLERDSIHDIGRQSYNEGFGILCQVGASARSSSQITFYNQFQKPGQHGLRYVFEGMGVDFGTVASHAADGSAAVISVSISDVSSTTVDTMTISATTLNVSQCTTFCFLTDVDAAEMKGLRGLVDKYGVSNLYGLSTFVNSAALNNINRSTYSRWNSNVSYNSSVGRVMDSLLIQKMFDSCEKNSGKDVDLIIGEYDVITVFADALSTDRRFATPNYDAGVNSLSFNGKALVKDYLSPYNELYFLNKEGIQWYVLEDYKWDDAGGSIWHRAGIGTSAVDAYEAFYKAYLSMGVELPGSLGVIRDIKTNI